MAIVSLATAILYTLPLAAQAPVLEPIELQRITVPQDKLSELGTEAVPVERKAFEQQIAGLNARFREQQAPVGTLVVLGRYSARFDSDQLVAGAAELHIQQARQSPSAMPLPLAGIAASSFRWLDGAQLAQVGLTESGQQVVVVPKSGVLAFDWSLRGSRDENGRVSFSLALPPATANQLTLELPSAWVPQADRGVLTRQEGQTAENVSREAAPLTVTWQLDLGPDSQARLELARLPLAQAASPLVLASQEDRYRVTTLGLELRSQVNLDFHHGAVARLRMEADPGLQLVSAYLGSEALSLIPEPKAEGSPASRYVIELPRPLSGAGRHVTVTAYAPLVAGGRWPLPAIRWQGFVWQQRSATLDIFEPLVLKGLQVRDGTLRRLEPLPAPATGASRQFSLHSLDAGLEIIVDRDPARLLARTATVVSVGEAVVSAQFIASLSTTGSDIFTVDLLRDNNWIIDSIETVPPENLLEVGAQRTRSLNRRLQLSRPINSANSVKVVVKAHRSTPESAVLSGADLRPIQLVSAELQQPLVAVSTEAPLQLSVSGDADLARLDLQALPARDADLAAIADADLLYADNPSADALRIALRRAPPDYEGKIAIEALAEDDLMKLAYVLRCEPVSSRVSQLRVRFSPNTPANLNWSVVGEPPGALSARPVPEESGEWEILLRRARSVPFEIRATSSLSLAASPAVPLASLPEAVGQTGTVLLAAAEGTQIAWQHHGLKQIPAPQPPPGRLTSTRGLFHFEPAQAASLQVSRHNALQSTPSAWIWSAELVSRFDAGPEVSQRLLLKVENTGVRNFSVQLPAEARVQQLLVEGEAMAVSGTSSTVLVTLPRQIRFPYVCIAYTLPHDGLSHLTRVAPQLPEFSLPCLSWRWSAWLPPGYTAVSHSPACCSLNQPSWDERLLGYAVFRRGGQPSNLLHKDFWNQPWVAYTRQQERSRLSDMLQTQLIAAWQMTNGLASDHTWSSLLDSYATRLHAAAMPELWIDATALSHVGILPGTQVLFNGSRNTSFDALLRDAHLVLLVCRDRLVLTSQAAQASGAYGPCSSLTERIWRATSRDDKNPPPKLIRAAEWDSERLESPDDPWRAHAVASLEEPLAGWSLVVRELSPQAVPALVVYRTATAAGLVWACLFIAAGVGVWVGRRRVVLWLALFLATGVLALLAPGDLVPLARASFLGLLAASLLLVRSVPRRRAFPRNEDSLSVGPRPRELVIAGSVLFGVAFYLAPQPAQSQPPGALPGQPPRRPHFVLYDPVDENGQPAGSYVYASRSLYEALNRFDIQLRTTQNAWLLESADYALELRAQDASETPRLSQLTVEYGLSTFGTGSSYVRLPFRAAELQVLEATLNGTRIFPQWLDDGERLGFEASGPGQHRLRLVIRPARVSREPRNGFDIPVPALANSRLRVKAPDFVTVDVPSAIGAVSQHETTPEKTFDLGTTDRLSVEWSLATPTRELSTEIMASQLAWLRPDHHSSTLDVRWKLAVRRGAVGEVQLEVDPRWQLLPFRSEQPVRRFIADEIREAGTAATAYREIQLILDRTYQAAEEVTLQASFVISSRDLPDAVLPRLISSGVVNAPWLGVSEVLDGKVEIAPLEDRLEIKREAFAEAWGNAQAPSRAFQLADLPQPLQIRITARKPSFRADEEQYVRIRGGEAEFTFYGRLEAVESPVWQLRLAAPNGLVYKSVTVIQDDVDLVRRWASDGAGTTTIFLNAPLSGQGQLSVVGSLAIPPRGEVLLDLMKLTDSAGGVSKLQVYRQSDVLVTLRPGAESGGEAFTPGASLSQTVATWEGELSAAPRNIALDVVPNPARFSATLITALKYEAPNWFVEADVAVGVESGALDSIRLRLPTALTESLQVTPTLPVEVRRAGGPSVSELLLRPPEAVTDTFRMQLRSALKSARGGGMVAPEIEILDASQTERFLVLPKRAGEQLISWDLQGLDEPQENELHTTYRIRGSRMRAALQEIDPLETAPQVYLADIELTQTTGESYLGVARFDLYPGALNECVIEMPPHVRLVHVTVEGLPALIQQTEPQAFTVRLGSQGLPQRMTVAFTGSASRLEGVPHSLHLQVPSLRNLAVDKTLWTLRSAVEQGEIDFLLRHAACDGAIMQQLRVASLQRILSFEQAHASQHREEDLDRWRAEWQRKLTVLQPQLVNAQPANTGLAVGSSNGSLDAVGLGSGRYRSIVFSQQSGAAAALTILVADRRTKDLQQRWLPALGLLGMSLAAGLVAARAPHLCAWVARWPYLVGVLAGISWWLWLSPSSLGWAMIGLFVAASLRSAWSGRSIRRRR